MYKIKSGLCIFLIFSTLIISAHSSVNYISKPVVQSQGEQSDSIALSKYFLKCLNSGRILSSAKDLFSHPVTASLDSANLMLDSLYSGTDSLRLFYFHVTALTIDRADGAYGESLCYTLKLFFEKFPDKVYLYFTIDKRLPIGTFNKCTNIVCTEIDYEIQNGITNSKEQFIKNFKKNISSNTKLLKWYNAFMKKVETNNEAGN